MMKAGWWLFLVAGLLAGVLGACANRDQGGSGSSSYAQPDYHSSYYLNQPGG